MVEDTYLHIIWTPCPWCGDEIDDTPAKILWPVESDTIEVECGGCGRLVTVLRDVTIAYHVARPALC